MRKSYARYAWVGMFLMTIDVLLLSDVGLRISTGTGLEETVNLMELAGLELYSLSELPDWEMMINIVRYIRVAALVCILVPVLSQNIPSNLWYMPMVIAGAAGLVFAAVLFTTKDKILVESGIQTFLKYFSVECNVTGTVYAFTGTSLVELICGAIPLIRKHK